MSKGTPRVTVRIAPALMEEIQAELESQSLNSPCGPEDLSAFIVKAIRDRIDKRRRSRSKRRKESALPNQNWPLAIVEPSSLGEGD